MWIRLDLSPGEPLSLGRRSSGGRVPQCKSRVSERPVHGSSTGCDCRAVESEEFRNLVDRAG